MSEEHKRKIGKANRIALKGKHCSPKTEFKKGHQKIWVEGELERISGANSPLWKGGVSRNTTYKVCIKSGKDITKCQICKDKNKRLIIHHCDGNKKNNNPFNLGIVCTYCHYAIHNTPKKIANQFRIGHEIPMEIKQKIAIANTKHGKYSQMEIIQ